MARIRKRRQRTKQKNTAGLIIIGTVFSLIAVMGYYWYQFKSKQHNIDPVTLCTEGSTPEYVALIFDKTDAYNQIQQRFLTRFFEEFKAKLQAGTHISLYHIDDQKLDPIQADYEVCAPRTGEDANALYENPKLIKQRWREQFEIPLDRIIVDFMKPGNADYSPILEILQVVSLSAFPVQSQKVKKKIIIISDMLHHTREWSHYRGQMSFKEFEKTQYFQKVRTDLHGAEVIILYVRRDGAVNLQTKRHAYFWADYIQAIGGQVSVIEKIDG